jgi:hypothetical protein
MMPIWMSCWVRRKLQMIFSLDTTQLERADERADERANEIHIIEKSAEDGRNKCHLYRPEWRKNMDMDRL